MYGKIFASMYEGSMVGMGPTVFAVWGYCIAKADCGDHTVLLNPALLASVIGTTPGEVETAIERLTSPDDNSKNKVHGGRRLLHQSGFCYLVVSHEHYRNIKTSDELRIYNRDMKRLERDRKANVKNVKNVKNVIDMSMTPASASVSASGVQDGECKGETVTDRDSHVTLRHVTSQGKPEPELRFTLEDCQRAAQGIGMTPKQVQDFFTHYAGVNFVDGAGRDIVSLPHALAKWKTQDGQHKTPGGPRFDRYAACPKPPEPKPGMEGWSEPQ